MTSRSIFRVRALKREMSSLRPKLLRVAVSWTRDMQLAEDLVQETMIKALKNLRELNDSAALGVWLFRIMANNHKDWLRKRREIVDVDSVELQADSCPETEYEKAAIVDKVQAAVALLNDDHRKVLTLVDLNGFTYKQVSAILDVPVGTVMSRVSRARLRLKELLSSERVTSNNKVTYLRSSTRGH